MMNNRSALTVFLLLASLVANPLAAFAHDYPTRGRVEYVLECMRKHSDKAEFEMLAKCSCAIDRFADEVSYDEFVEVLTATLAVTIGGERGVAVRDAPDTRVMIKRYRALEEKANETCFIR